MKKNAPQGKEGRILVVDDDKVVREFLETFLDKKEFQYVWSAANAREALEILDKEDISLVLLDVMLPDADGVELLKKIKKKDRKISVVMITGHPDEDKARMALKEGAEDYIIKPFDLFYLELTLVTILLKLGYKK